VRCKVIHTHADGRVTERLRDLDKEPFADEVIHRVGIASVVYKFDDGSSSEYFHAEYGCDWCESYDHDSNDCPRLLTSEGDNP